jgi:hypothetical protein
MAVVRLPGDRLLLYSPVFLKPELRRALDDLGRVAFVLAPNKLHNQSLAAYQAGYPEAEHLAPPGLAERRPDLVFTGALDGPARAGFEGELESVLTSGNVFFSELLLFHRRSRTLLVGDLVENFERSTVSGLGRAAARLFGVGRRPVASPEFRFYTLDPEAAARSLERARSWDFRRIFLCHGRLVTSDAQPCFRSVCDELLATSRRRSRPSRALLRGLARLQ